VTIGRSITLGGVAKATKLEAHAVHARGSDGHQSESKKPDVFLKKSKTNPTKNKTKTPQEDTFTMLLAIPTSRCPK